MAEGVLFNVAGELITKLGSRHLRMVPLCGGVKAEFEKLQNTVKMIQAVLLDAEEQYTKSNQVKIWVQSLKEAFYDADDLLDEFSTQLLRRQAMDGCGISKEVWIFFSSSNQVAYGLKMAFEIKAIRERLKSIHENRSMFFLEKSCLEKHVKSDEREQTHSSAPKVVVGRENDKNVIVELLLSSSYEEDVSIISIVGIGGLGKTTLAQYVYNDEIIESHFELKLWASVSDNFDLRLTVAKILESVTGERHLDLQMNTLKNLLHAKINGKKYLLVLDDLWNENWEKWFQLKELVDGGDRGSRIMVTSRLKNVAEMIKSDRIYELKCLNDADSWSLFKDMAFKQGQVPSSSHERIGKEIIAKCAGVPLAIKVIGRLLYFKNTVSEWQRFKDEQVLNVDHEENGILRTLKLSYNHLPSHLKHCFAYCSLFPKGSIINVESLVYLWMAQGYIKSSDSRQCLEDTGYEYFTELLWRSFFQVQKADAFGAITSCKVHDLMHELAAIVAGGDSTLLNSKVEDIDGRVRHVSFGDELDSWMHVSSPLLRARKLRTFAAPSCKIEEDHCRVIFSNLKRLRVLNLHNLGVETIPSSVAKLKHIRYLDLSHNKGIALLPDSITELQTLQVLILTKCERLRQLPKHIRKLVSLRLLNIWGCDCLTYMPQGLRKLTTLQNLSTFIVANESISNYSGGLSELHDLNNLRGRLDILNLRHVQNPAPEFEAANLKEKQHLQSLLLSWKFGHDGDDDNGVNDDEISIELLQPHLNLKCLAVYGYGRIQFPSWVSSLTNLVIIEIGNCKRCQNFPALDQFPSLQSLTIKNFSDLEYMESNEISEPTLFFPSLEKLRLMNCPNLKGWRRNTTVPELLQFHRLTDLWIESCSSLASMPLIPSVKRLVVRNAKMESLEDILKVNISVSPRPVSQLTMLHIDEIEDLEFLPEQFFQNLTFLRHLVIVDCSKLTTLSNAMQHLTSLQILNIEGCKNLLLDDENDIDTQWQCLINLQHLVITNFQKLTRLPEGLQHVTTLQKLSIKDCPNLMSLPEWMGKLTALRYLEIYDCPQLSERCRNDMAADWHKIAHVPSIRINGQ